MDYHKVKQKNLKYFTRLLEESDDEHYVVAQSKISHRKRFEKILELGDFNDKTLLDVGCGIGGFFDFLKEKGINCDYTGVEINPRMIRIAQKKHPEMKNKFFVFDIIEENLNQQFDYVISNGPLNLKFESNLNMEMTMRLMEEMYHLAAVGIAITMTSSLTRKPHPTTFYYNPLEILTETFEFCTNVRLDHTYLPHDFALFCYKKDLYDF
ncbi:MAG: class I SAM-dependent methyltransferase [Candidatus Aminicenantes bacterium]|nr:MAG: class I SAM-dependent methyltransferase [Candidatus Aminicenantes bacterium]